MGRVCYRVQDIRTLIFHTIVACLAVKHVGVSCVGVMCVLDMTLCEAGCGELLVAGEWAGVSVAGVGGVVALLICVSGARDAS